MSEEFEKIVIERFDKIDQKFNEMNQKMDNMNVELNQKIDSVNIELNQKIDNVNTELNQKIDILNQKVDNVNVELGQKIDNVNKELTEKINDLSGNIAVLEYKVTTELPAVYEAHTLNYDTQKKNEKKLNAVLETTSKLSIHITHLYETVRNHEEQLRKLTS